MSSVKVFTRTTTNGSVTIAAGALQIAVYNSGSGTVTLLGNFKSGSVASNTISVASEQNFTLPLVYGRQGGYPEITFTGSSTTFDVVAVY